MITFNSKVTEKGNFKVDAQVLDIIGVKPGDTVNISVEPESDSSIRIPQELLDEAGIDESRGLDIYTDDGCVIISEAEYGDE